MGFTSRSDCAPGEDHHDAVEPQRNAACGGVPYSSASRKNPKRDLASSSVHAEGAEDLPLHILRWIRIEPEPSSVPLSTTS